MQFTAEDFELPQTMGEIIEFFPIVIFLGLVAPFVIAAYSVGGGNANDYSGKN